MGWASDYHTYNFSDRQQAYDYHTDTLKVSAANLRKWKERTMGTPNREDVLRYMIEEAQRELMQLQRVPDPATFAEGTVLRWTETYGRSGSASKGYSFAALKAAGSWYLTGGRNRGPVSDAELRERLTSSDVSDLSTVTAWITLGESAPATSSRTHGTRAHIDPDNNFECCDPLAFHHDHDLSYPEPG